MKEYEGAHQYGRLFIESDKGTTVTIGDVGIQISEDGRIWMCLEGVSLIRFKPIRACATCTWFKNTCTNSPEKRDLCV